MNWDYQQSFSATAIIPFKIGHWLDSRATLQDVDALIDVLVNARSYGEAWASYPVLKRYQMRRMADNFIMQSGMDLFYAGFSNNLG